MRYIKIRWLLFSVDVAASLLTCCVLLLGHTLGWLTPFHWWYAIAISALSFFIYLSLHQLLCSPLFLVPLRELLRLVKTGDTEAVRRSPRRVAELHELASLFADMIESSHKLAQQSEYILRTGQLSTSLPAKTDGAVGDMFARLVNALTTLERLFEEMTEGDLGVDIPDVLLDTKLGQRFREMKMEIRTTILHVREEVLRISKASAEIAAMSQQGSQNAHTETDSVENISSSIHEMASNLREVMQNITRQGDSVEKTFTDIENMITSIEEVNNSVELLSASADSTARSIDDIHKFMQQIQQHAHSLAGISESISKEAHGGVDSVGEVIEGIRTIKQTVEDAATTIQRLGRESDRIGEILEVINGVAEQTNLLALNASIIAAQAGAHGRGFSVVAGEIKELAERTRSSTKEIAAIIRSLQTGAGQGILAMKNCLQAVDAGVSLSNTAGGILKKIMESIQGARDMATTLAEATVKQTQNSQQVTVATERITQKLDGLHDTAIAQSRDSAHLAEMAAILKDATQHIELSVKTQMHAMDNIVVSIEDIQDLVRRNADIAHHLASSSEELELLGSNLSEHMGHFLVTRPELPPEFQLTRPTIVFMYPGAPSFYGAIYQGITMEAGSRFQTLDLDCQNDPVLQAEYVYWLLHQPWFFGLLLTPFDEHTGGRIVTTMKRQQKPIVVVDRLANQSPLTVLSDNKQGGIVAAELLRTSVPEKSTVFTCGPRNIHSIFNRMEGFAQQGRGKYQWNVVDVFTSIMNIEEAKSSILTAYRRNQEVKGIFATNEHASLATLELFDEGSLPAHIVNAVSYDLNPAIANAIRSGVLCGTVFQDPPKIGRTAVQELLALHEQRTTPSADSPRVVLVPVTKVTRENLSITKFS